MLELDGSSLTCRTIAHTAQSPGPSHSPAVSVSAPARERVQASFDFARSIAQSRPIYGRSTGVGANRHVAVSASDEDHALRMLRSHATSAGEARSRRRVRAMLVVRLNQLAAGGSGADPRIVDALAEMLSIDAQPTIHEYGSIGTGDLSALAVTALALVGEEPSTPAIAHPVTFTAGDALPFLSSNAATIGDAALAADDLGQLSLAAIVVAALTFVAVRGNPEAFSSPVTKASPFPGVTRVCTIMSRLIDGCHPARIQDPFGLRTMPQVHGAFLDTLVHLEAVVDAMANAPSENPLFLPGIGVAHHGGFHAAYLVQAVDSTNSAIAQAAQLSLARLTSLSEPSLTSLSAFLSDDEPGASGIMIVEYVATSALARLRGLATPAGLASASLSRGAEDEASFASAAARSALTSVDAYATVLACELVAATRGVRLGGFLTADVGGPLLRAALEIVQELPDSMSDRNLTADLQLARELLPRLARLLQ